MEASPSLPCTGGDVVILRLSEGRVTNHQRTSAGQTLYYTGSYSWVEEERVLGLGPSCLA